MRIEDAPRPGWYPDPEGTSRLRYWEGTDWSDRFRARPTDGQLALQESTDAVRNRVAGERLGTVQSSVDPQTIVEQVRLAARQEAERAAELFAAQARSATANLQPLISEYTSKFTRWIRILATIAVVIAVAWVIWQVFAQVSLFNWIGDRIDGLTDQPSREPVPGWIAPLISRRGT